MLSLSLSSSEQLYNLFGITVSSLNDIPCQLLDQPICRLICILVGIRWLAKLDIVQLVLLRLNVLHGVLQVKYATDGSALHVYWTGDSAGADLVDKLPQVAGKLRHTLTQLQIVGRVPHINFIQGPLARTNFHLDCISLKPRQFPTEDTRNSVMEFTCTLEVRSRGP